MALSKVVLPLLLSAGSTKGGRPIPRPKFVRSRAFITLPEPEPDLESHEPSSEPSHLLDLRTEDGPAVTPVPPIESSIHSDEGQAAASPPGVEGLPLHRFGVSTAEEFELEWFERWAQKEIQDQEYVPSVNQVIHLVPDPSQPLPLPRVSPIARMLWQEIHQSQRRIHRGTCMAPLGAYE